MPCSADYSNALETLLLSGAYGLAHVGFALCLALILGFGVGAKGNHCLQNALEKVGDIAPLLNLPFPPQFVVGVACCLSQQGKRVVLNVRFVSVCGDWVWSQDGGVFQGGGKPRPYYRRLRFPSVLYSRGDPCGRPGPCGRPEACP